MPGAWAGLRWVDLGTDLSWAEQQQRRECERLPGGRERDRGGPGERRGDQRRERDHLPWRRALSMRSL